MTSPSPTLPLARRLGAILGLSEGLDGPTTLRMPLGDYDAYLDMFEQVDTLSGEQSERFMAEFAALYLPSLLRTLLNNPIGVFDAIHPKFFESFLDLANTQVSSSASDRYLREHPTEAIELRAKALSLIVDWSERVMIVSESDRAETMRGLVQFYSDLTKAESVGQDDDSYARPDPLRVSVQVRTRLRNQLRWLESLQNVDDDDENYARSLDDIHGIISPEKYKPLRGSYHIDLIVESGIWYPWWSCEAKYAGLDCDKPELVTPCDKGTRNELRTCARCLAVRYCSERHQKQHWKQHKLICVAPTW